MDAGLSTSGKAGNLQKLRGKSFPVPMFLTLSIPLLEELIEPVKNELNTLRQSLVNTSEKDLPRLSNAIVELITSTMVPVSVMDKIRADCRQSFGENYSVAVRSSALQEDRLEASFAGQMNTYLNVGEKDLEAKIKSCLASAYSHSAIQYRKLHGIDPADGQMEVIIQQMVLADKSGVIFTMNPNGNLNETAVVAGLGAGEGVVTGSAETDHYFIDRSDQAIRQKLTGEKPVLNQYQLQELFALGKGCEDLFQQPQDIEFSIDTDGKIWILQSRPITSIPYNKLKILDNSNIVESYPGITLPLSFSFARNGYEQVFRGCAQPFGISEKDLDLRQDALSNLITHLNGRVYYRLDNWYRIMSLVMTSERQLKEWENNLGIRKSETKNLKISYRRKLKSLGVTLKLLFNHRKLNRQFYREFEAHYAELRDRPSSNWTAEQLYRFYSEKANTLFRAWAPTQVNDFIGFRAFSMLQKLLESLGFEEEENLANDLMCGMKDVESEMPMLKLLAMKELIEKDELLMNVFEKHEAQEILTLIRNPQHAEFNKIFQSYLDKYGDRTLEELKLETPNLRQEPALLVKRILQHLNSPHSVAGFKQRQQDIRQKAEKKIKERLSLLNPKKWLLKILIAMSRYGLRNRENMRLARTRSYGAVKDIFRLIGEQMKEAGLLQSTTDVFFLDHSDLEYFCLSSSRAGFKEKVAQRKKEYKRYADITMPNRVIYYGDEAPQFVGAIAERERPDHQLKGIPVSRGRVTAPVLVLHHPNQEVEVKGKILVTRMTDPGWLFLMSRAEGLISEKGSLLSHTAIVGRELGLPTIVGIDHATQVLKTGQVVTMDGATGVVEVNPNKL